MKKVLAYGYRLVWAKTKREKPRALLIKFDLVHCTLYSFYMPLTIDLQQKFICNN